MNTMDIVMVKPEIFNKYEKEATAIPVGTSGKTADVRFLLEKIAGKTYLTDVYNTVPARLIRPLYYDEENPEIPYLILSNPTGGIVQGDRYNMKITLREGAEAFITDSTATKIYKMEENYASRITDIYLYNNARLEYIPKETILFKDSRWFQSTRVHIIGNPSLLYSDIIVPGRIFKDEEFWQFNVFSNKFIIEDDNRILLNDSSQYYGSEKDDINLLLLNNKYILTVYWLSNKINSSNVKLNQFEKIDYGYSNMPYNKGIFIRALSNDLDKLKNFQMYIWAKFREIEANKSTPFLRIY